MPSHTYNIPTLMELSIRNDSRGSLELDVTVIRGRGEVFGTPLEPKRKYTFPGGYNFAIYTHMTGCSVKVEGDHFIWEVKKSITQFHWALSQTVEKLCLKAEIDDEVGPAIMIVGPQNSGKTSLLKHLLNYAVRAKRNPLFVDLDVGQNSISLPGTIAMIAVQQLLDPVREFDGVQSRAYHFGHKSPEDNKDLYEYLLEKIAYQYNIQVSYSLPNKHSPCFINTCEWVRDSKISFDAIVEAACEFEVTCVFVIGETTGELAAKLKEALPGADAACDDPGVEILSVVKASGVVEREPNFRQSSRILKVQQYFKGFHGTAPTYRLKLSFGKIKVFRSGKITLKNNDDDEGPHEDRSPKEDLHLVPFHKLRLDTVLSVMEDSFPRNGPHSCLTGYVIVYSINMESEFMDVFSTQSNDDRMTKFLAMNYLSNTC